MKSMTSRPLRGDRVPQVTRAERDHAGERDVVDLRERLGQLPGLRFDALGRFQARDRGHDVRSVADFARQIAIHRALGCGFTPDRDDVDDLTGRIEYRRDDEVDRHRCSGIRTDRDIRARPRPTIADDPRHLVRGNGVVTLWQRREVAADELGSWTTDVASCGEVGVHDPAELVGDHDRLRGLIDSRAQRLRGDGRFWSLGCRRHGGAIRLGPSRRTGLRA